jgi:5-methylthioadenosine/S-adenosylhomocysteine deaminase
MNILYKNAGVVTQNYNREIVQSGYVSVRDGFVDGIGTVQPDEQQFDDVIDLEGGWLLPGFVNSHVHLGESVYFPFINEKLNLSGYLDKTEEIYASSKEIGGNRDIACKFSLYELILNGVTAVGGGRVAQTARALSIPNTSGYMLMNSSKLGHFSDNAFENFLQVRNEEKNLLTQHCIFIHSLSKIGESELATVKRLKHEIEDLIVMIHVEEDHAENAAVCKKWGSSSVCVLKENKILDDNTFLVHGNHLSGSDLDIISESGATLCHCLTSNLTVADDALNISEVLNKNINLVVATDGPITGAGFNLLNEVRKVYQYQNRFSVGEKVSPQQCLDMITINAAHAIGQANVVGSIEVGKLANFVVMKPPFEASSDNFVNTLIRYELIDVSGVVINGRKVVWNKELLFEDWPQVQSDFSSLLKSI